MAPSRVADPVRFRIILLVDSTHARFMQSLCTRLSFTPSRVYCPATPLRNPHGAEHTARSEGCAGVDPATSPCLSYLSSVYIPPCYACMHPTFSQDHILSQLVTSHQYNSTPILRLTHVQCMRPAAAFVMMRECRLTMEFITNYRTIGYTANSVSRSVAPGARILHKQYIT